MKNKSELTGTGKVFRFTLYQMFHNKAYIGTLLTLALLMLLSVPFMVLAAGGDIQLTSKVKLETVMVVNDTDIPLDVSVLSKGDERFADTAFVQTDDAAAAWADNAEALIHLYKDENGSYQIDLRVSSEEVQASDEQHLLDLVSSAFIQARYEAYEISDEQLAVLSKYMDTEVRTFSSYEDARAVSWEVQYGTQLVYAILVLMCSVYTVTYIIQSLAEEKSSKLVEFLLVSVRPQALVMGKIFACMTYVASMLGVMLVSFGVSYFVTGMFMDVSAVNQSLAAAGLSAGMFQISPLLLLVMLISLLIGYTTFAMMAGIFGSACATIQDVQKATMVPMLIIMAGYMVACIGTAAESRTASIVFSLIPGISVFCAPVEYIVGNISLPLLLLSWVIQLAMLAFLSWFGGKVYNDLIMHRGGRVGMKEMISIARANPAGRRG